MNFVQEIQNCLDKKRRYADQASAADCELTGDFGVLKLRLSGMKRKGTTSPWLNVVITLNGKTNIKYFSEVPTLAEVAELIEPIDPIFSVMLVHLL